MELNLLAVGHSVLTRCGNVAHEDDIKSDETEKGKGEAIEIKGFAISLK